MDLLAKNKPVVRDLSSDIKMFLYGPAFIGKTTFASTFPDAWILSTDGNYKHLNTPANKIDYKMKVKTDSGHEVEVSGWEYFKKLMIEAEKSDFKTIVIDNIGDVYDMGRLHALARHGATHESDIKAQGKAWKVIDTEVMPVIKRLLNIEGKNVICIAHSKTTDGKIIPNLIPSLTAKLQAYVGINALMKATSVPGKETTRALYAQSSASQAGGNRLGITTPIEPTYKALTETLKQIQHKQGEI